MKWRTIVLAALLSLNMAQVISSIPVNAQGAGRTKVFVFSEDFPPDTFFAHPIPAIPETRFWQLLDKNLKNHTSLELTENLEEANYRVDLKCAGVVWCQKLKVYLMTPHRDVLTSYSIPGKALFWPANLSAVAQRLSSSLNYQISNIEQGGIGNYGLTRFRKKPTAGPKASQP